LLGIVNSYTSQIGALPGSPSPLPHRHFVHLAISTVTVVSTRRAKAEAVARHIIANVFALDDDAPLAKALAKAYVTDIHGIISLDKETLDSLVYDDVVNDSTVTLPLPRSQRTLIGHILQRYNSHHDATGSLISDFSTLTQDEFDDFCKSPVYMSILHAADGSSTMHPSTTTSATKLFSPQPVDVFKRGIMHDPTLFTTLKDSK
jgi:hypothetical protein